MVNAKRIIQKKHPTGEDLGRLAIARSMEGFRGSSRKRSSLQISDEDFQKLLGRMIDPEDKKIYNGYREIYNWLIKAYWMSTAYTQQAFSRIMFLTNTATTCQAGEEIYNYVSELPAIMTEKQYKDLVARRREETIHPETQEALSYNIGMMFSDALEYYVRLLTSSPKKRNPLKALRKTLENEPVTDSRILDQYNALNNLGYYELSDGSRSDNMSEAEWDSKLEEPDIANAINKYLGEIFYEGFEVRDKEGNRMSYTSVLKTLPDLLQAHLEPAPGKEKEVSLDEEGNPAPINRYIYREPPKDLNKWDMLTEGGVWRFYPAFMSEDYNDDQKADTEIFRAFKEEFPEIVNTILQDMERYIPGISSLPIEEWASTRYSFEDLYKMDYYGFRSDYVEGDMNVFSGDRKAIGNGIAILRASDILKESPRIDKETGYYKAPDIRQTVTDFSLEGFLSDSKGSKKRIADVKDYRETFLDSYYFLNGFNIALDLIADAFKVDEIKAAKVDLSFLDSQVKAFNDTVGSLYRQIKEEHYEDPRLRRDKLSVLRNVLYPIDTSNLKASEATVEKAKSDMIGFKSFTSPDYDIIYTLGERKKGE